LRALARAQKSIKDVLRRVVGADVVDDKKDFISKEVDRIISSGISLFPPPFFLSALRVPFFSFFLPTTKTLSQKQRWTASTALVLSLLALLVEKYKH